MLKLFLIVFSLVYSSNELSYDIGDVYEKGEYTCIKGIKWEEDLCIKKDWDRWVSEEYPNPEKYDDKTYQYEKIWSKNSNLIEHFDMSEHIQAKYHIYEWKVIKTEYFNDINNSELNFNYELEWYVPLDEFKKKKYFWVQTDDLSTTPKLFEVSDEKIKNYNGYYFKIENVYFPIFTKTNTHKKFYKLTKMEKEEDWWWLDWQWTFKDFQFDFKWNYPRFKNETVFWGYDSEITKNWENKDYYDVQFYYDKDFDSYSFLVFWKDKSKPVKTDCFCNWLWLDYNYVNNKK